MLALLAVALTMPMASAPAAASVNGWTEPISSYGGNGNWEANGCGGNTAYVNNLVHLGSDYPADTGTPVRAIADGTATFVHSPTTQNAALHIRHQSGNGTTFTAIYGHIHIPSRFGGSQGAVSVPVTRGEQVGTIRPHSGGPHLHFGIWQSADPKLNGWGRRSCAAHEPPVDSSLNMQFRAPATFLNNNPGQVSVSPDASVSPTRGDRDTTFEGTASGFTPNASVTQSVTEPDGSPYPTSRYTQQRSTNGSGEFTWQWYWESGDPFGTYEVRFRDDSSGEEATVSLTIESDGDDGDSDDRPAVGEDGSLLRVEGEDTVYVIAGGARFSFASRDGFEGAGYEWDDVHDVTQETLDEFGAIPEDGTLVRDPDDGAQHVIAGGASFWFSGPSTLEAAGYGDVAATNIPPAHFDRFDAVPDDGTLLRGHDDDAVWLVEGGERRTVDEFDEAGVVDVDRAALEDVPEVSAVDVSPELAEAMLLGGTAAITDDVGEAVADHTDADITRLHGDDRFATSAAIADHSHPDGADTVYLATATDFADALTGSAAAAADNAPLLLTLPDTLPDATRDALGSD